MRKFAWAALVAAVMFGAAYWLTADMAPECATRSACPALK